MEDNGNTLMVVNSIINYLKKEYGVIHFKINLYCGIYITDLIINAPANPFGLTTLHASSAHYDKNTTILKTAIEMIERLVFISHFVGPIDFIDQQAYVIDTKGALHNISLVSPYFSKNIQFNSKGHACHIYEDKAKLSAQLEYYEKIVLENINFYTHEANCAYDYSNEDTDISFQGNDLAKTFSFYTLQFDGFWFSSACHKNIPGHILGSACDENEEESLKKAFLEAISKQEIAEKNSFDLAELSEKIYLEIPIGCYRFNGRLDTPSLIKRHNQALGHLNLFMYQAVERYA